MTPVRPNPLPNASASGAQRPDVARNAAQKAFFQAAMGQAQAPAAAPQEASAPRPVHRVPTNLPADPPERILRPGSLLDIRV